MTAGIGWLDEAVTTIALCWRVERRDGVTIGLTAHDRDLEIDGLVHRAAPGMVPSAIKRSVGLEADTMDVSGALTGDAFTPRDLLAGRWDGARVMIFAADWTGAGAPVPLGEGTIGAVEMTDHGFTAELLGAAAALDRPAVEATAPECRAALGDRRCRVALRRYWARVRAIDERTLLSDVDEPVADAFGNGTVRWFGGANSGLETVVARSEGRRLVLGAPPAFDVAADTLVELVEGCDKSFATCRDRFGNAANFRGEPHLPGLDLITRWPGG